MLSNTYLRVLPHPKESYFFSLLLKKYLDLFALLDFSLNQPLVYSSFPKFMHWQVGYNWLVWAWVLGPTAHRFLYGGCVSDLPYRWPKIMTWKHLNSCIGLQRGLMIFRGIGSHFISQYCVSISKNAWIIFSPRTAFSFQYNF